MLYLTSQIKYNKRKYLKPKNQNIHRTSNLNYSDRSLWPLTWNRTEMSSKISFMDLLSWIICLNDELGSFQGHVLDKIRIEPAIRTRWDYVSHLLTESQFWMVTFGFCDWKIQDMHTIWYDATYNINVYWPWYLSTENSFLAYESLKLTEFSVNIQGQICLSVQHII